MATDYAIWHIRYVGELAAVFRDARTRRGVSQRDLARRVGTVQSAISEWENGTCGMNADSVLKVADELGYDVVLIRRREEGPR